MADKSLNKSELVAKIAAATNQSQSTVDSVLNGFFETLADSGVDAWVPHKIQEAVAAAAVAAGLVNAEGAPQLSKAQGPVRLAVSGRSVGPPLWESLTVLGPERTLARLRDLRSRLD